MGKFILLILLLPVLLLSCQNEKANEPPTIAGIIIQNDIYMRTVQLAMKETGEAMKINVLQGNSDANLNKESQLIDTYIDQGVKAIVIQPLSAKGSAAALNRAIEKGIKVILLGTKANIDYSAFIASDDYSIGEASGEAAKKFVAEHMPNRKLNIATVSFVTQYPEQAKARTTGFIDKFPNTPLIAQQDAWTAEMAIGIVGDMLTANPTINIIHAANEGGTVGAVQAIKNAGLQGKVFVFGTDGSDQMIQLLEAPDNILQAVTAQRPYTVGKLGIESAVKALKGEALSKEVTVPIRPLIRGDTQELTAFKVELKKI